MKISVLGDVMPGGMLCYQKDFINSSLSTTLKHSHLRVATLECPLGGYEGQLFNEEKMNKRQNIIYAPSNRAAEILKELKINIVSLANNHILDLGTEGLINTLHQLDKCGILYGGAGLNIHEASKPVSIISENHKICFLMYCDTQKYMDNIPIADNNKPGINPLIIEKVLADIIKYKRNHDFVFVLPHWGYEYVTCPETINVKYAKMMIKAGADGVFGSHTHHIQPYFNYKGKPVFMSLGNGLFPDFIMAPPRPIFYPSPSFEIKNIPNTKEYPFPVTQLMKRVWPFESRIGAIAQINLLAGTKLKSNIEYIALSDENILQSAQLEKKLEKRLRLLSTLSKSFIFSPTIKCLRLGNKILHKLRS